MRGLALAALVLSGCGANAVEDAPSLAEVAAATRAQSYAYELTMNGEGLEEPFRATATGAAEPALGNATVRYVFDEGGEAELTTETRRVGGKTYVRLDDSELGSGWMEATHDEARLALPFGAFSEPHLAVDALVRHGSDVETFAGEEVEGVPVVRHRATVPLIELFGADLKGEARKDIEAEIRETGSDTARVDAWADMEGVLRKLAFSFSAREDGREGRFESTTRFFDFGKPVEVEAPPASEVSRYGVGIGAEKEPCKWKAAPHAAEAVIDGLRDKGYEARGLCVDDETVISAFPAREDGDEDNDAVLCFVTRSPQPDQNREGVVVRGSVACVAEPLQRVAIRAVLAGL